MMHKRYQQRRARTSEPKLTTFPCPRVYLSGEMEVRARKRKRVQVYNIVRSDLLVGWSFDEGLYIAKAS